MNELILYSIYIYILITFNYELLFIYRELTSQRMPNKVISRTMEHFTSYRKSEDRESEGRDSEGRESEGR